MKNILLSVLSFLLAASSAWACSCVEDKNLSEEHKIANSYTRASLVIVGRVVKAEPVRVIDSVRTKSSFSGLDTIYTSAREQIRYTFAVSKLLKGKVAATSLVTIMSAAQSAACGVNFKTGMEYLVYAYTVDQSPGPGGTPQKTTPYYATGLCERHQELRAVKSAELRQLRRIARKASGEHKFEWFELLD